MNIFTEKQIADLEAINAALRQQLAEVTRFSDSRRMVMDHQATMLNDYVQQLFDEQSLHVATQLCLKAQTESVQGCAQKLAEVTQDKQYHMDCINLLAKHIGRLGDTSHTVVNAAIQQLAEAQATIADLEAADETHLTINDGLRQQLATSRQERLTREQVAAQLHLLYLAKAHELGWPVRHECDVPYDRLTPDGQALDLMFADWHLAQLDSLDQRIEAQLKGKVKA